MLRNGDGYHRRIKAPHSPGGGPSAAETRLVATPAAASAARRFIADTLEGWSLETAVDDAVLCASELVTNAVLHAGGELVVRLTRNDGHVLLEVVDERPLELSAVQPRAPMPDNAGMTGRGLSVLASLASEWGVDRTELPGPAVGKVVWAQLPVDAAPGDGAPTVDVRESAAPSWASADLLEAELVDVPARTFLESEGHYDDVLRELQLTWLGRPDDGALGTLTLRVAGFLAGRGPSRATSAAVAREALAAGGERVHLLVAVDAEIVEDSEQFLRTMDEIETRAARGEFLVPPPPPGIRAFRYWFVGELARQYRGEPPLPCPYA
ncbi:MAG: ATP-binding protein [Actinobacteria bacterium]|nr:ATP-binding protein [Actinomycetota bacterium]